MKYEIRKLQVGDLFRLVSVLQKLNFDKLTALIKSISSKKTDDKRAEELGVQIFGLLISELSNCQKELYVLIGGLINKDSDYIDTMPLDDLMELIKAISSQEGIVDFFKQAFSQLEKE